MKRLTRVVVLSVLIAFCSVAVGAGIVDPGVSPLAVPLMRPTLPGDVTLEPESYAPLIGVNWSPLPTPTVRPTPP